MNKALLLSLVLFCCGLQMQAQTLTEAEVTAKMNEAFALNNAKKTAKHWMPFSLSEEIQNSSEMKLSIKYMCAVRQWLVCVMKL